jgi:hypothetical protein
LPYAPQKVIVTGFDAEPPSELPEPDEHPEARSAIANAAATAAPAVVERFIAVLLSCVRDTSGSRLGSPWNKFYDKNNYLSTA